MLTFPPLITYNIVAYIPYIPRSPNIIHHMSFLQTLTIVTELGVKLHVLTFKSADSGNDPL